MNAIALYNNIGKYVLITSYNCIILHNSIYITNACSQQVECCLLDHMHVHNYLLLVTNLIQWHNAYASWP